MENLLIIVHVVVCIMLVGIVLLQHGKGADAGAAFGGSNQTLFGSEGPLPLLNKITTAVAVIFMITSVSLAYISTQKGTRSLMSDVQTEVQQQAPVQPALEPVAEPVEVPKAE